MGDTKKTGSAGVAVLLAAGCLYAGAQERAITLQTQKSGPLPTQRELADRSDGFETRAFYLRNSTSQNEENEILTALRQMVRPMDRLFVVPSAHSIIMRADADDLALAARLIEEMDRPRRSYRLIYTFVEKEGGNTLGQQRVSVLIVAGQRTEAKAGNRVPITVSAPHGADASSSAPQITYIDVGVNIDVTGDEVPNGLRLRNKVERSSAAEERSPAAVGGDPIIRQSLLEETVLVQLTKSMILGTLDIPGSPRTLDVSVAAELVK